MAELQIGDKAPDFALPSVEGGVIKLSDFAGQSVVLYFYPKDATSGCALQACEFQGQLVGAVNVLGVSRDGLESHKKFAAKQGLSFPLLSDVDGVVCQAYGTWAEKSMYGRKYMGIERTTFLIGPDGRIANIWRKVKVAGHADAVLVAVQALKD